MQQTQVVTSGATTTTTSPAKTTQKQNPSNPKTSTISTLQTSVMKPVGMITSQNQSKGQSWKGRGSKISTTSTASTSAVVPTTSKNDKPTGPITRSKAKNDLIQLLETILENLLSDSKTECEERQR